MLITFLCLVVAVFLFIKTLSSCGEYWKEIVVIFLIGIGILAVLTFYCLA